MSHRIVVIGASYAGMCSALALCSKGFEVEILERSDAPHRRGSGVVVQPRMEEYLRRSGLESRGVIGVLPAGRRVYHRDGRVEELPIDGTYYTGWDTLLNRLEASLPAGTIRRGYSLDDLELHSDSVTARFHNGETVTADVLVGADGIGSRTRSILDASQKPTFAGYVAYRGVVPESSLSAPTRGALSSHFNIVETPRGQMVCYPISGVQGETGKGERRINWVWYVPDTDDAPESFRDRRGVVHRSTVAPGLVREDVRSHIIGIARREFPPQFEEMVENTDEPFLQRVMDMMPRRMVFGRAVLVGDSASIVRPHTGSGSAKAVADAILLADHLSATTGLDDCAAVEAHLSTWEEARLDANRRLVERGRRLAADFGIDE